jgi:hypothetical protein
MPLKGQVPQGRELSTDVKGQKERGLADLTPWAPLLVAVTPELC